MYRCELCGRWFCEEHIEPRTFLVRGLDIRDEQMPEGIGLDDIPVERAPQQGTLLLGTSIGWMEERARGIMDRFRSRKKKQKKWKREGTHPDFQYTRKWLEELNIEEKKRSELMKRALNRMNRYFSREKLQAVSLKCVDPMDKIETKEKLETERHFPTKDIAFLLVIFVLAIVFWYAPTIISYLQRI